MTIDLGNLLKAMLVFLMLFLTFAVNMPDNVIARLGFDPDYLMITLVTVVITGLIAHRRLLLIVLVILLSLGANMPQDFMLNFGIERDYLFATLIAIVLTPLLANWLD